jgi:predicted ATPase
VRIGLKSLNVVTGANGSGKSSLYRALRLLADIAQGRIIQSLAAEGGLHSTLWAGPESFARSVKRGERPVQGTVRKARAHEEQISQRAVGQLGSLQGTEQPVLPHLVLEKHLSETLVQDGERPAWPWPPR